MSFIAHLDGEAVLPVNVDSGTSTECPKCGSKMHVVRSYVDGDGVVYRRHFSHNSKTNCNGESPMHINMKMAAVAWAKHNWPDAEVQAEYSTTNRRADVAVLFDQPMMPYGKGIAIEVQHMNVGKDKEAVQLDNIRDGLSTMWLEEEDFDENWEPKSSVFFTVESEWPRLVQHEWDPGVTEPDPWIYPIQAHFTKAILKQKTEREWPRLVNHEWDPGVTEPDPWIYPIQAHFTKAILKQQLEICERCNERCTRTVTNLCRSCLRSARFVGRKIECENKVNCTHCGKSVEAGRGLYRNGYVHDKCVEDLLDEYYRGQRTPTLEDDWWRKALKYPAEFDPPTPN